MFKKISVFIVIFYVLLTNTLASNNPFNEAFIAENGKESHTILVELGSLTTCPYCPEAINSLNEIFDSQEIPFYYMVLVYDKSEIAQWRGMWLGDVYVPVAYIDGGYKIVQESSEKEYRDAISAAMERDVNDIDMNIDAQWNGNNIEISLNIVNNDEKAYLGHLKICIVEINSRWRDYNGEQIHYALMDYAYNGYVMLKPEMNKKIEMEWNNKYGMEEGNTMILACISDWHPRIVKNPWNDPLWSAYFIAQFVDEVCVATL